MVLLEIGISWVWEFVYRIEILSEFYLLAGFGNFVLGYLEVRCCFYSWEESGCVVGFVGNIVGSWFFDISLCWLE